ncbi:MAG: OmpA family protein [Bacteroidetes bacterium]|nr:OmpA family protein [Bacteroidota bacterium]
MTKDGSSISAKIVMVDGSSVKKNEFFILKKDGAVVGTVQADSNGVVNLKALDPAGLYTLQPVVNNENTLPYSFNPALELSKNSEQVLLTKKGVALTKVLLDNEIQYDQVKVEELFLNIPEGPAGSEKVVGQVFFNGQKCVETNVEIFVNGKIQSLAQTDGEGIFVSYMNKLNKNSLSVSINELSYSVPLIAKDFVQKKDHLEVAVNIDNLSLQKNQSSLAMQNNRVNGPLQIMKDNQLAPNTKVRFVPAQGTPIEYTTDASGIVNIDLDKDAVYTVEFPEDLGYQKSSFVPLAHTNGDVPLAFKPYEDIVSKKGANYILMNAQGKVLAKKHFVVMDHGGKSGLMKTDANGKLPKGFSFSDKGKIILQEKGTIYSKNIVSILSSDTILTINTNEKSVEKAVVSQELSALILDEYAAEVESEVKVEVNQTKILVRVMNVEIVPATLTIYEGAALVKDFAIENNMRGFGLLNDKKYNLKITAENYKDYTYSFEPKSISKDGRIVIKAQLLPLVNVESMELSGKVTSSEGPLPDVRVRLYEEGETFGRLTTEVDGKYLFKLKSQNIYTVSVGKDGYETKQFSFIPEKLLESKGNLVVDFNLEKRNAVMVVGQVLDNNKPVSNASVQVYDEDLIVAKSKTDTAGFYEVELQEQKDYTVSVTKAGYFQNNFEINTPAKEMKEVKFKSNVKLSKIESNKLVEIPNIYFAYKSVKLSERSIVELDRLVMFLELNPQIKMLEIRSHSDEIGSNEYNLALSKMRAKAVVAYLINEGISSKKLIAIGLGEQFPLIKNAKTDSEHEKNRRTEFKVVLQ